MPAARVLYSIVFLTLFMMILLQARPPQIFRPDGSPIPFGVGHGRTLFTLGVVTVAVAALTLFAFALVDVVYRRPSQGVTADFA